MTVLTWPPGALSMGLADLTLGRPPTRWGGRALLALLVEPRCGDSVIDHLWCGLVWWGLLSSPANAGLLTAAPAPTSEIAMNTVAATFLPKLFSMVSSIVVGTPRGVRRIGAAIVQAMGGSCISTVGPSTFVQLPTPGENLMTQGGRCTRGRYARQGRGAWIRSIPRRPRHHGARARRVAAELRVPATPDASGGSPQRPTRSLTVDEPGARWSHQLRLRLRLRLRVAVGLTEASPVRGHRSQVADRWY